MFIRHVIIVAYPIFRLMHTEIVIENDKKHSLGRRAFILFLSQRIKLPIFLAALTFAAWYSERWVPFLYRDWAIYIVQIIGLLSIAYCLMVLFWTYMEYRYYTYMFTDEAFIMTSGYIVRNELAALYHQIQNVNIQRGPLDRITGVSRIIIFMTGAEKDSTHNRIILPAVGKRKAKVVQRELLSRARRHIPSNNDEAAE
jgi:membrane protein YdbS with pleckstrin-like domain